MALASLPLFRVVKSTALIALVALLAVPTRVVAGSDPQQIYASPSLPPGADLNILNQMVAASRYTQTIQLNNNLKTRQQPSSFSACLQNIMKQASALNNLFTGLGGFSFATALKNFGQQCEDQLENQLDGEFDEDVDGPHTVQNGIIVETSITNLLGSTGPAPVLSIPKVASSLISNPAAAALVAKTAQAALDAYNKAQADKAAADQADADATAANAAAQQAETANPSAANAAASSAALAQKQAADAAVLAAADAASAAASSNATASSAASGGGSPGDGSYDSIDVAANSMGVSITANAQMPAGLLPDPNDTSSSSTDDTPPPGIPLPPTPVTYDNPDEAPQNATICISPSNRSDLDYADATEDTDAVADFFKNTAKNGLGDSDDLDDTTNHQTQPMQAASIIVPQPNSPNPGDKPTGQSSQVPAGIDGVPGCAPFAIPAGYSLGKPTVGVPGVTATGMPCTANTNQSGCMAGSGCSSQNGKIGYAKDYQSGTMFSHGPYSAPDGSNKGQCAQLVLRLVPANLLHTPSWRKGRLVYNNAQLQFGTPIATFFGPAPNPGASEYGQPAQTVFRYEPNIPNGNPKLAHMQHTGLFMGYTKSCMFMFEEGVGFAGWGSMPHLRCMPWGHQWNGAPFVNKDEENHDAMNYHVVCNAGQECPQ